MATTTTNYSFSKPAATDTTGVRTDYNAALDAIDTAIKARADAIVTEAAARAAADLLLTPARQGYRTGSWYGPSGQASTRTFGSGDLRCVPYLVRSAASFDRIQIEVTTAGTGSTVFRMGIWNNNPATGHPGTLVADYGTIDGTAAPAIQPITISPAQSLAAGWYWLGVAAQDVTGSPVLRGLIHGIDGFDDQNSAMGGVAANSNNIFYTGITGAFGTLAATAPGGQSNTGPAIILRAA